MAYDDDESALEPVEHEVAGASKPEACTRLPRLQVVRMVEHSVRSRNTHLPLLAPLRPQEGILPGLCLVRLQPVLGILDSKAGMGNGHIQQAGTWVGGITARLGPELPDSIAGIGDSMEGVGAVTEVFCCVALVCEAAQFCLEEQLRPVERIVVAVGSTAPCIRVR